MLGSLHTFSVPTKDLKICTHMAIVYNQNGVSGSGFRRSLARTLTPPVARQHKPQEPEEGRMLAGRSHAT